MRIISIDPGGTTGWATCSLDMNNPEPLWLPKLSDHFDDMGQLTGEHHRTLRALLIKVKPDLIVCERFEHRNNDFAKLVSLEYIGVVKLYSQEVNCDLVLQGASQALVWCSNQKMDKLDLLLAPYQPWKDANAARKHLVYYLIHGKLHPKVSSRLLAGLRGMRDL